MSSTATFESTPFLEIVIPSGVTDVICPLSIPPWRLMRSTIVCPRTAFSGRATANDASTINRQSNLDGIGYFISALICFSRSSNAAFHFGPPRFGYSVRIDSTLRRAS